MSEISSGLTVRPGDILVVSTVDPVPAERAERMRQHLLDRLPGLVDVVLIVNATGLAVYRPGSEGTDDA